MSPLPYVHDRFRLSNPGEMPARITENRRRVASQIASLRQE